MDVEAYLRRAGLPATAHRVQVLKALAGAGRALTPQELLALVGGGMNRVTLYRILDLFVEHGLAQRHSAGERALRYCLEASPAAKGHGHFHCNRCGRTECLPASALDLEALSRSFPFTIEHAEVRFDGICADCLKNGD